VVDYPLVALVLAVALIVAGCSPTSTPRSGTASQAAQLAYLKSQNAGLQNILLNTDANFGVAPEVAGDVTDGVFMAKISGASAEGSRTVLLVDVVTDANVPDSDIFPVDKFVHYQRVPVGDSANNGFATLILLDHSGGLVVVPRVDFASRFKQLSEPDDVYYVELVNGEAVRVWPVAVP
jgi:hypothetical protein